MLIDTLFVVRLVWEKGYDGLKMFLFPVNHHPMGDKIYRDTKIKICYEC